MIADRARFRHARKIERAVGYRIPDLAFHGATLDALSSRLNTERLDNVLNGVACCGKYVKEDMESPGLFDEWLIEIESMHEAMASLKNFDEEAGESS